MPDWTFSAGRPRRIQGRLMIMIAARREVSFGEGTFVEVLPAAVYVQDREDSRLMPFSDEMRERLTHI